jgi:hypothetical protein
MFLFIWIVIAIASACIAAGKGRSALGGFVLGALLGIFGLVIVCCMTRRK